MRPICSSLLLPLFLIGASMAQVSLARGFKELVGVPDWQLERNNIRSLQTIEGFADPEVCYPALEESDANQDGLVDQQEYVDFCKMLGPDGFLDGVDTFEDIPLQLQSNFFALACLCQTSPDDDSCCVGDAAGIRTDGALEGDDPTPTEESYLFLVCSLTASAVERVLQSSPPSPAPSDPLTKSPSRTPTVAPSEVPAPSASPSEAASDSPSDAPVTSPPTDVPTAFPTTSSPTDVPTRSAPSLRPTSSPTPKPVTAKPTRPPQPTSVPQPVEEQITTTYRIGVKNGANQISYKPQLVDAMNSLAPEVLASVMNSLRRRRLADGHNRRRLQSVSFPTVIEEIQVVDCPSGISSTDICEDVMAIITLIFQPDSSEDSEKIADTFSDQLEASIAQGQLGDALQLEWPESDVYIIDDTSPEDDSGNGITSGGITGIVIGSFVAAVFFIGFFANRQGPPKEELEVLEPMPMAPPTPEKEIEKEIAGDDHADFAATLGATSPDYGKFQDAMMDNDDAIAAMSLDGSSSNAGSSGWSSSAGVSSLNTGSQDGLSAEGPISAFGATLAALAMTEETTPSSPADGGVASTPAVTRADLDSAIESGDWAAVGATAALLAAASDSQSLSSQSGNVDHSGTISRSESNDSSLDAVRVAELDHLVESGDWEGVVLAAAKYEAADTGSSNNSPTIDSGSFASSPSKARKRQEFRGEVEELVRRVVPEEIQNVDEMMQQFRGREEELIETLRTMEERAVAQKARQGAQRQAKTQAKQKTPEERDADAVALLAAIPGSGLPGADADGGPSGEEPAAMSASLGTGQIAVSAKSLGKGQVEGTPKAKSLGTGTIGSAKKASARDTKQSALEEAIEAGDWEAVGQAAAMLSDQSLASSVETEEINRLADGLSSQGSDVASNEKLSGRAEELEELIERGDWTGVVNAAAAKTSEIAAEKKGAEEEARRQRQMQHEKEEEEALAQASIWEAIAQRTKEEAEQTTTDRAASDAADWAIGRSLRALVQAEQGDRLPGVEPSGADASTNQDTSIQTNEEEEV